MQNQEKTRHTQNNLTPKRKVCPYQPCFTAQPLVMKTGKPGYRNLLFIVNSKLEPNKFYIMLFCISQNCEFLDFFQFTFILVFVKSFTNCNHGAHNPLHSYTLPVMQTTFEFQNFLLMANQLVESFQVIQYFPFSFMALLFSSNTWLRFKKC